MSLSLELANVVFFGVLIYMLYQLIDARRRHRGQPPLRLATRLADLVADGARPMRATVGQRYALWLAKRRLPHVRVKLVEQAEAARARNHFLGAATCRRAASGRWIWRVGCLAPHCGRELVIYETVSLDARGVTRRFDAEGELYTDHTPCPDQPL